MTFDQLDIIFFSLTRWDSPYSSTALSLAKELAKTNRVFYIDNPFTLKDVVNGYRTEAIQCRKTALLSGDNPFTALRQYGNNFIAATPRATLPINFLPSGSIYERLSRVNDQIVFGMIKRMLATYSIQNYVFVNSFNPFYCRRYPSFFEPILSVYHCVDDINHSPYVKRHGLSLEIDAIRRADVTLTTSRQLKKLKASDAREIYLLPNAADVSLFQRGVASSVERPGDLPDGKIIMYTGHIDTRVDYDLVLKIAQHYRDYLVVLVGPVSIDSSLRQSLGSIKNIVFTGRKPLEELPSYLKFATCAIIPFVCNVLTESIYPLKVNEYLAAGIPVVATNFSEDICAFSPTVAVSESHETFIKNIASQIQSDSPEKRKERFAVASSNTWESRVQTFKAIVEKHVFNRSLAKKPHHV